MWHVVFHLSRPPAASSRNETLLLNPVLMLMCRGTSVAYPCVKLHNLLALAAVPLPPPTDCDTNYNLCCTLLFFSHVSYVLQMNMQADLKYCILPWPQICKAVWM